MVALLATPAQGAHTPASVPASGTLMHLTVDQLPADHVATIGITRTTYMAGGSLQLETGSGPAVSFVESGAVTVTVQDGGSLIVATGPLEQTGTPAAIASGSEVIVTAGNGFLPAPGATVNVRNDGTIPATVLELFSATDAEAKPGKGTTQALLVRQEATLTEPAATVTLGRVVVEPGDRLPLAAAPAITVYVAVERGDAFLLSGQGVNRSTKPIAAYILEIAPPETSPPS